MSVRLINGAIFLHVPKTGGDWVTNRLQACGLVERNCFHKHATYDRVRLNDSTDWHKPYWRNLPPEIDRNVFTFCFVREPLEWYISYWRYTMDMGKPGWGSTKPGGSWHPLAALNECWSTCFESFLNNVCDKRPGFVTELFSQYAQPQVNFVGHTETLVEDLLTVLRLMGFYSIRSAVESFPRVNASVTLRPKCGRETINRIIRTEYAAYLRYGYDPTTAGSMRGECGSHQSEEMGD